MRNLTLRLIAALSCFAAGVIASYTYPVSPHQTPAPESEVAEESDLTPTQESEARPRGESAGLDESILERVARSVSGEWGGLRFAPAFCTCPGIIPDQKSYRFGYLSRGKEFVADAYIAEAASVKAAASAMAVQREGRDGWQAYGLGDEAYLRKSQGGRSGTITLRVSNVVAHVSGELEAVEMLSKRVADALAAS